MRFLVRLLRNVVVLALTLLLLLSVVTAGRIAFTARQDDRRASDVIVVLGAAQFNGRPGPYLEPRLHHAKDLYDQGIAPVIVTTGGSLPGDPFSEASAGEKWLEAHGVPERSVLAIPQGSDTLSSMLATGEAMRRHGWDSAVVVTDPWHSLRSTEMLDHAGIDAVASPTRTGPSNSGAWAAAKYTARETGAYLNWYRQRVTT
ncbi:MAG TPA: YdcF family protein [Actinomycetales bacterium]|nr:YdcF family protein [Actinomycetales bacterium]